jgi:Tol biopolymer transport system component
LALTPGTRLGVYEVTAQIGVGGMGEVYRATDGNLKRQVAIKVLPASVAGDADRLARFQREAEVLASLNHPNIAIIHGLEKSDGATGLVMELVEGPTLADRIAQGPIPIDEALPIAKQIAEALEAAHEQGIIHRDLKPANIKVRPDGTVKVLDFGLAKAMQPAAAASSSLSMSPTITTPAMTQAGIVLGTAAYMAPEQARGKIVDKRADIWAFGCVLYEMLTGRRAFDGEGVTEILGRVVTVEPDWSRLPAATPASIQRLLRRALKKDSRQRLGDIRDARVEIEEVGTEAERSAAAAPARGARLAWIAPLAITASVIVALAIPTVRHLREPSPREMHLQIVTPSTPAPFEFALSPDGRYIVFVASGDGPQRLWLRALDKVDEQPMAGTEGADLPFWSADSRSIGYVASGKLYRIDIAGGPPQFLANAPGAVGPGAWNADGTILFGPTSTSPLLRIAASGGEATAVTRLDSPHQSNHRSPQFLPDGRYFLFYAVGQEQASGIYLGSLDGGEPKRLMASSAPGQFLKPDLLVFLQQGALVARRLDIARGALTGDAVTLAVPVPNRAIRDFSVSVAGQVAYRPGGSGRRELTWFDRTGRAVGVADPDANNLDFPDLSPDGGRMAASRTVRSNRDVWLMDVVRGGFTRLTFDAARDYPPVWSPDGMWIAFSSDRTGTFNLYLKSSSGAGTEKLLLETPNVKTPQDWSKDGRFLLYYEVDPTTARNLWALEMTGTERKPRVVVSTRYDTTMAQFSPDGRWLAYQTNESGRFEIVVQSFPEASGKWQVSSNGGIAPRWRADGKELYFVAPDRKLMAVPVIPSGSTFEAGTPVMLFPTGIVTNSIIGKHQYAVSRDGRFLINHIVEESVVSPITLILNWNPGQTK